MNYHIFLSILSLILTVTAIQLDFSEPLTPHIIEETREIISSHRKDLSVKSSRTIIVEKVSSTYCQIRVDFEEFLIGEIDQQGYCLGGFSAGNHDNSNNFPDVICGENHGQHVYLNFNGSIPIELYLDDFSDSDYWTIRIQQIVCTDSSYKDNALCLQYFNTKTGNVKSFGYTSLETLSNPPATYQLANQDYYVCVGTLTGKYDSVIYSRGDSRTNYFFLLTSNSELIRPSIVGTVEAAEFDSNCTSVSLSNDYIEIINGTYSDFDGEAQTSNLFCGAGFPSYVTVIKSPYRLHVVTNDREVEREGSVGFSLSYELHVTQ
ncbi:UNVERIFIED_CONTAM: hypothetical protein RMT77_009775 [Armadillidium vulgare]